MTNLELLTQQTESVYDWTNKLVLSIPFEKWNNIPDKVETSVTWQVGHLLVSHYFNTMMVIVGHQMDILQKIPMKEYDAFFTTGLPKMSSGKIDPEILLKQLQLVQSKSIDIVKSLTADQFDSNLEPTTTPHPIAKTKREAIDWNIKHTMYHCGQIGILKRIIDTRFDFGLRR